MSNEWWNAWLTDGDHAGQTLEEAWAEELVMAGAPIEAAEAVFNLLKELHGSLGADAWRVPQFQMRFLADRLEHYARELRRVANVELAELLWPEEEVEL